METMEVQVSGMTCGGCENSVRRALERLPGVVAVTAEHASGRVVVDSDGPLDRAEVAAAIEDAGYEVAPEGRRHLPLL